MKEIAIFGGSFNPPTKAHEAIVRACLERPDFDEVWIMPSGDRTDKDFDATHEDRINMLTLMTREAFPDDPRLKICEIEFELPQPTQTWRTITELRRRYEDSRMWYVYGVDAYYDMPKWDDGDRIQNESDMLLVARNGTPIPEVGNVKSLEVEASVGHISSTEIRQRIVDDQPLASWVCSTVAKYIKETNLYATVV